MRDVRRLVLLFITAVLGILLVGGVAMATSTMGTTGADDIVGTEQADSLEGNGGDDSIEALGDADNISADGGNDVVWGGDTEGNADGGDSIFGGSGSDWIAGGRGADSVYGGPGDDTIVEWPSDEVAKDIINGGDGDDIIHVANDTASEDIVACGPGIDEVDADALDVVASDCEDVERGTGGPTANLPDSAPEEAPITGGSGDFQVASFNCWVRADNPHHSNEYPQVAAKGRTWCENNQYSVYTRSELWRLRWSGWRYLDVDKNTQFYWYESKTNVRWGCNNKISTWYRNYTYGRVRNNGNVWDGGWRLNESDNKIRC